MPSNPTKKTYFAERFTPQRPTRRVLLDERRETFSRKQIDVRVNVDVKLHLIIIALSGLITAMHMAGLF